MFFLFILSTNLNILKEKCCVNNSKTCTTKKFPILWLSRNANTRLVCNRGPPFKCEDGKESPQNDSFVPVVGDSMSENWDKM